MAEPFTVQTLTLDNTWQSFTIGSDVTSVKLQARDNLPISASPSLWLSARHISTLSFQAGTKQVSQWDDKSGSGFNATQSTSAKQPVYTHSAINGRGALLFDGSDDYLTCGDVLVSNNTNGLTILAVVDASSNPGVAIATYYAAINRKEFFLQPKPAFTKFTLNETGAGADNNAQKVLTTELATPGIICGWWNPGAVHKLYWNNVHKDDSGSAINSLDDTGESLIIGAFTAGLSGFFDGYIGEIIVFPSALSAGDMSTIHSYLAYNWGVTL